MVEQWVDPHTRVHRTRHLFMYADPHGCHLLLLSLPGGQQVREVIGRSGRATRILRSLNCFLFLFCCVSRHLCHLRRLSCRRRCVSRLLLPLSCRHRCVSRPLLRLCLLLLLLLRL